jgi:peroxiredoxin
MVMSIAVGSVAPDFTLRDQSQKEVKLSDFAGKKNVVLMFYPLDWSPTCTSEHACFVNEMKAFETLDAEVLGVSVKNGNPLFVAGGFSAAWRDVGQVWRVSTGEGHHREIHRDCEQGWESGVDQTL